MGERLEDIPNPPVPNTPRVNRPSPVTPPTPVAVRETSNSPKHADVLTLMNSAAQPGDGRDGWGRSAGRQETLIRFEDSVTTAPSPIATSNSPKTNPVPTPQDRLLCASPKR